MPLRRGRELAQQIMETSPAGITVIDLAGQIIFANPQAEKVLGMTQAQIGRLTYNAPNWHITDYEGNQFPPQKLPFRQVLATGRPVHDVRHAVTRPDGKRVLLSVNAAPLFDESGQINGVVATLEDVSERVRAERELLWEVGVNEALAELSQALIRLASVEEISLMVLDHAKRLTGSAFGYVGYIDQRTGHLVSSTLTRDVWDACQVADKDVVFEKFCGLWGWVLENRQPILCNDPTQDPRSEGVPPGHLPIRRFVSAPAFIGESLIGQVSLANPNRDYTERDLALVQRLASLYALAVERQRAQQALQSERDKAQQYLNIAGVMIVVIERDQRVSLVNKRGCEILGYREEEILGQKWFDTFVPEKEREATKAAFGQLLAGETEPVAHFENAILTRGGEERLIAWHNTILRNREGQVVATLSSGEDVTERRQAEKARQRELDFLKRLYALSQTSVTAQAFGQASLRRAVPDVFDELVREHGQLLELVLEERAYQVDHSVSKRLQALAGRLGFLRADPRDVVEVHTTALQAKIDGASPPRARAYADEGRLIVLELMGYLASHYRNYAGGPPLNGLDDPDGPHEIEG